jgi:hypothetical protein
VYNYWVLDLNGMQEVEPASSASIILSAGYLVRNVTVDGPALHLVGDTNQTTSVEVIGLAPNITSVTWNGQKLCCTRQAATANALCSVTYTPPGFQLPDLSTLDWQYADSLPELLLTYDDSMWTAASNTYTNNTQERNLTTPTSLYSTDYGYNTGTLIYRTHFTANGEESELQVQTQGGSAFSASIWLNQTFLGSWTGLPSSSSYYQNLTLPHLEVGSEYAVTVVQDMMGLEESGPIGPTGVVRFPRLCSTKTRPLIAILRRAKHPAGSSTTISLGMMRPPCTGF